MRRGSATPSPSTADSAYDRYAMGRHAPPHENDGEDWDDLPPCANPPAWSPLLCVAAAALHHQVLGISPVPVGSLRS